MRSLWCYKIGDGMSLSYVNIMPISNTVEPAISNSQSRFLGYLELINVHALKKFPA